MLDPATRRYVEALFSLAKKHGVLDIVRHDVERLEREVDDPSVAGPLFDARLPSSARRATARELSAGMHALVQNFVMLLLDKRREGVLRQVGQAFRRRTLEERGAAEGVAESARALPADELARLARSVGAVLGKEVRLENRVRPELLGGVRVIVDSKMIDHSLQGRLEGLKKRLLRAPLAGLARD